jgi:hypothetical protein
MIEDEDLCHNYLAQIHYDANIRQLIYWTKLNKNSSGGENFILFNAHIKINSSGHDRPQKLPYEQIQNDNLRKDILRARDSVDNGVVRVFMDNGAGRIYLNNREIADNFRFGTAMSIGGYWLGSPYVLWEINKKDDSTIVAQGYWIDAPFVPVQTWTVKLRSDNVIEWKVGLQVNGKIELKGIESCIEADDLMPKFVKFTQDANNKMCNMLKIQKPIFWDSRCKVIKYYGIPGKYLEAGHYDNYFSGRIVINQ